MKRKCVITVKGEDGKRAVNVSFKFYPPLIEEEKDVTSGFNSTVANLFKAVANEQQQVKVPPSAVSKWGRRRVSGENERPVGKRPPPPPAPPEAKS